MLLREAAVLADELRRLYYEGLRYRGRSNRTFHGMIEAMRAVIMRDKGVHDFDYLIDILYPKHSRYPERLIDIPRIRLSFCREIGVAPVVWDEVLRGKPLVPALAQESPEEGGMGWSVKEALHYMTGLYDRSVLTTCSKMNELEARLFWSRALGEKPCIPVDKFLQVVSNTLHKGRSIRYIRSLLTQMTPAEVFASLFSTDPVLEAMEEKLGVVQPGLPFNGPVYQAWTKATLPGGTYLSITKGMRRYLHITEFPKGEFRGTLYTRDRKAVRKYRVRDLPFENIQELVVEVEMQHDFIRRITDIFALGEDWRVFERPYRERMGLLSTLTAKVPVEEPIILEEGSDVSYIFDKLEDGERARLISGGPIVLGGEGGWTLLQKAFHLHLLATHMRRDKNFGLHVRLATLDGFEPFEVYKIQLEPEMAHHFRERMAREGMLAGPQWVPIEEHAVLFVVEVQRLDTDCLGIEEADVICLDDNLGYSDTSQLTDLIELSI